MINTNPFRHRDVNAQDLLDMPSLKCMSVELKIKDELEGFSR